MAPYSCNRQSAAAILRGLMAQDRMTRIVVLDQSLSFPFRPLPAACKLRNPAQIKMSGRKKCRNQARKLMRKGIGGMSSA